MTNFDAGKESVKEKIFFDMDHPEYIKSWYIPNADSVLRIVCFNVYQFDGVGNCCLDFYRLCLQNNISVVLYANGYDKELEENFRSESDVLLDAKPNDTLLYFHSTYDPLLDKISQLNVKRKIVYFLGITNPIYFKKFEPVLFDASEKAFKQLSLLAHFDRFGALSLANAKLLTSYLTHISLKSVFIIPPKLVDKSYIINSEISPASSVQKNTKLLYVGRIASSKKIEDLIQFFASYLTLDAEAECWIVGWQSNKNYQAYLEEAIDQYLGSDKNKLKWLGKVSDQELENIYRSATAYISMSEDEGFCLPLFEAMAHGLPVFAYGILAVCEVLGGAGRYFTQKNFLYLAKYIYQLLIDEECKNEMIKQQYVRVNNMAKEMDGRAVLRFLEEKVGFR